MNPPKTEILDTAPDQEPVTVPDLTQAATAVFEAHGVEIDDLSQARDVYHGGMTIMENRGADGNSRFDVWSGRPSPHGMIEHIHGSWTDKDTEVIAHAQDAFLLAAEDPYLEPKRVPLDEKGLAELKDLIETGFPVPEVPEKPSLGVLGHIRKHLERRATTRAFKKQSRERGIK